MKAILLVIYSFGLFLNASEYDHHSFKKFEYPERSFSIIVSPEGYYPDHLFAFEGEKIRLFVTSTLAEPQCLLLQGHDVFLSAKQGKISEGEAVFDKPGEYSYYCPGFEGRGRLVVLGKDEAKDQKIKTLPVNRELATEKKEVWKPRDN